jgi:hypothetical protein
MLRRAAVTLGLAVLSLGVAGLLAEGLLRARPGLIGREVLLEFERELRAEIADRRGLPLKQARRCLASEERADGGPELCLIAPGTEYRLEADPEDRALGAVERLPHDARGFCNPPAAAAREQVDVVAIGDSFTWCTAVEPGRTWPAALERRTGVATYGLGVPGVGPFEYVEVLSRFGVSLAPRVVVVGVYGGNDLRDAVRFVRHRARADRADAPGLAEPLLRRSYAASFVAGAFEVIAQRVRRPGIDFAFEIEQGGRWVAMNRGGGDLDEVRTARELVAGAVAPELWGEALARLAELADEAVFEVVLAYLPSAHAAYAPYVRFSDPEVGRLVTALDEAQRRALPALAERHGFAYSDCTAVLREAVGESELAYFPGNLHPRATGHALIAACLAPTVESLLSTAASPARAGRPSRADGRGLRPPRGAQSG